MLDGSQAHFLWQPGVLADTACLQPAVLLAAKACLPQTMSARKLLACCCCRAFDALLPDRCLNLTGNWPLHCRYRWLDEQTAMSNAMASMYESNS